MIADLKTGKTIKRMLTVDELHLLFDYPNANTIKTEWKAILTTPKEQGWLEKNIRIYFTGKEHEDSIITEYIYLHSPLKLKIHQIYTVNWHYHTTKEGKQKYFGGMAGGITATVGHEGYYTKTETRKLWFEHI